MEKIEITRKELIKAFKLWEQDSRKNPDDYEDTSQLSLKESSENSADHLISILSEIKKKDN